MERSMKPSYEQGGQRTFSELLSISLGLSLFWVCFFSFLLYKSFGDVADATTVVPFPIALGTAPIAAVLRFGA